MSLLKKEEVKLKDMYFLPIREYLGVDKDKTLMHSEMVISPDRRYLVIEVEMMQGSDYLLVWDLEKEKFMRKCKIESPIRAMEFSPNGKYIASDVFGFSVIDINCNFLVEKPLNIGMRGMAWRADNKFVAVASGGPYLHVVNVWEDKKPKSRFFIGQFEDSWDINRVSGVVWYPDGKRIAVIHDYAMVMLEWPLLRILKFADQGEGGFPGLRKGNALRITPDGKYLIYLYGGAVYDSETFEYIPELSAPAGGEAAADISVDFRYWAFAYKTFYVRIWDTRERTYIKRMVFENSVKRLFLDKTSKRLFLMFFNEGVGVLDL